MFNNKEKIRGLPCIVLKRCSSRGQVATSIENQGKTTDQVVVELALPIVDTKDLEGVTGSVPGNRTDIDELVARKNRFNDFKVLVIQDASRFTRAGQGHGQKLLYDLRAAGILVYFVAEDLLVDDEMAEMYAGFLFAAARHAVKMLAYNAVNGSTNSYLSGRSPYTKRPPFGLDRMYSDGGVDLHIIRNLPDGTQQQLHPQTLEVIRTFGQNTGKGMPQHYLKQKSETIRLIPGDPKLVAVLYLMYRLWLAEGWSFRRIALYLNDSGVPSSRGGDWHTETVRKVLLNPVYVGQGIRGRIKQSVYYDMTVNGPVPSGTTLEDLAKRKRVQPKMRPRNQWIERPMPHLKDFLPEEVRGLACKRIDAHLDAIADGKAPKANRDRHVHSEFWLKGSLISKQGRHPMTGRRGGKRDNVRSYGVSRGLSAPKSNNVLSRRIPAAPLEAAVMEVIRQVVLNRPGIEDALKRIVAQETGQLQTDQRDTGALKRELLRQRKRLALMTDDVTLDEDDQLTRKVAVVKAEIRSLQKRIEAAHEQRHAEPADASAVAAKLAQELETFGRDIHTQSIPHLRQVAAMLIHRMEADLETKEVEVELALPSWLGEVMTGGSGGVGLDSVFACKPFIEAHPQNRESLGVFVCNRHWKPFCYTCRRLPKAA